MSKDKEIKWLKEYSGVFAEGDVIQFPTKEKKIHFSGDDFMIEANELDPEFLDDLKSASGPGDASGAVEYIFNKYEITGDKEDVKKYLKTYGAWEEEVLEDHEENLKKLIWLTGNSLSEEGTAHFSTY